MDQSSLESSLSGLPLSALRYFSSLDSTNDEAWRWEERGASHNALVIADEQTAGRGRLQRRWVTVAGSGLAFSLIMLSPPLVPQLLTRLTGLAALAACQALRDRYSLSAQIKWPNDILINQRKAGGVLVESRWQGQNLKAAVIGVGINIASQSLNPETLPLQALSFPATCVEEAFGYPVDRMECLHAILQEIFRWQPRLGSRDFLLAWDASLAYKGQWVELSTEYAASSASLQGEPLQFSTGIVAGLAENGSLILTDSSGKPHEVQVGEIHLRLAVDPPPG